MPAAGNTAVVLVDMNVAEVFFSACLYRAGEALLFADHMEAVQMHFDVACANIFAKFDLVRGTCEAMFHLSAFYQVFCKDLAGYCPTIRLLPRMLRPGFEPGSQPRKGCMIGCPTGGFNPPIFG